MSTDSMVYERYEARKRRLAGEAPKPRKSTITIPSRCHPAVKVLFEAMRLQAKTYDYVERASGTLRTTLKSWRSANSPSWDNLNAVANVLEHELVVVPRLESLDLALRRDLEMLAETHGAKVEHLAAHLVETRALNVAVTEDGRARIQLWRERADLEAETRRKGNAARDERLAAAREMEAAA